MNAQIIVGGSDDAMAESLEVGRTTVERVRKALVQEGLQAALERRKPPKASTHERGMVMPRPT